MRSSRLAQAITLMFGETDGEGKTIYNQLNEPTDTFTSLTNIDNMAMGAMHLIAHEKEFEQKEILLTFLRGI